MKIKLILFLLFFIILLTKGYSSDVADTWANLTKTINGNFAGGSSWVEYNMSSDSIAGRRYIDMWLVPGSTYQYKFRVFTGADTYWEPSIFNTTSTNREIIIPNSDTLINCNWSDTPTKPTGLSYYSDSGTIILSWNYGGEQNLDVYFGGGFYVYYCTATAFNTWSISAIQANTIPVRAPAGSSISTLTYSIENLVNNESYYVTVRAFDAYTDTTGPKYSDYADSILAIPSPKTKVIFKLFTGNLNPTKVYVGYDTSQNHSIWYEKELTNLGSGWWADTVEINAGLTFTYKYIIDSGTKKYELDNSARSYMFIYPASSGVSQVQVKGSWDGWGSAISLNLCEDGYWRVEKSFSSGGSYQYKFIINGSNWVTDPYNPLTSGGNSVLLINATQYYDNRRELTVPAVSVYIDTANWQDTPYTPCDFRALSFSQSTIKLLWDGPAYQLDIDTYYIEYTETPNDSNSWQLLAEVDGSLNYYLHQNIIYGDRYYYRIWCVDFNGISSPFKNFTYSTLLLEVDVYFKVEK
ncbi:MAG TPA: hypothetical protein PLD27_12685 [bacterium]|nr:hypothetical protein [bacterium]HOK41880.1 hypothetical protein [bacterium]HOL47134.1 hypothetical protein [bacterium]HPQ17923.1 hypothetical protein [bacterium]